MAGVYAECLRLPYELTLSQSHSMASSSWRILPILQHMGSNQCFWVSVPCRHHTSHTDRLCSVFQTYYKTSLLPTFSNSTIAWIGTLTSFLLCASPITWGPIFDTGNPRLLVLFGSCSVVFGIMMTSLCTEYWQIMLAQGVCCVCSTPF